MKRISWLSSGILVLAMQAEAAERVEVEPCDVVVEHNTPWLDGSKQYIAPGSVICLAAGHGERGPLRLLNLEGTESQPIIVRNEGGVVTTAPAEYSIAIEGSQWVRVTSVPVDGVSDYGMRLGGTLSVGVLSHHVELDHLEIYRARFAGMLIKTDPNCDPATWQENFTMAGIRIHNNFIHDTEEGEGMYVGYTAHKRTLECAGEMTTVYPHRITDVEIYDNTLARTAADGIQLNSVQAPAAIRQNHIYRTGVSPFAPHWQNTGIQVGGDGVEVRGNTIVQAGGNGMMLDGDGLQIVHNTIQDAGENGIFARNAAQLYNQTSGGAPHLYQGNMIMGSGSYAITVYAVYTTQPHLLENNTLVTSDALDAKGNPMTFSYLNSHVWAEERRNQHLIIETAD